MGDAGNFPLAFAICGIAYPAGAVATSPVLTPSHEEAARAFTWRGVVRNANLPLSTKG
ncbi:MAG: hypothetical protein ABIJ48_01875 [Actinomycetota bacterium]